jgi:hypothetical protein
MDENLTSVNAEQVSDEGSQIEQGNESVNEGVATSQKPVQSAEDNAKFAAIRREAEQKAATKAKDEMIAEMYGESHGIYTYADYQKALADQKAQEQRQQFQDENGFDPDVIKPVVEQMLKSDPRYQRLEQMEREANVSTAVSKFSEEFPELGIKSFDDIAKLPNIDKMYEYVNSKGLSLNDAYKLANYGDVVTKTAQTAQQEAIKKIAANGASSPGSLAGGGETVFFTPDQVRAMSQSEVKKNFTAIEESMKHWK